MNIEPAVGGTRRMCAPLMVVKGGDVEQVPLPSAPRWLQQVHGTASSISMTMPRLPEADAAITSRAGVVCAMRTADCLPVLLAATDGSVVGAAHAGWRGLAAGVIEATVAACVRAWHREPSWSPGWGRRSVPRISKWAMKFARPSWPTTPPPPRPSCRTSVAAGSATCTTLRASGFAPAGSTISPAADCAPMPTFRFYSHRRDVQHEGQSTTGRMATLIWRECRNRNAGRELVKASA